MELDLSKVLELIASSGLEIAIVLLIALVAVLAYKLGSDYLGKRKESDDEEVTP